VATGGPYEYLHWSHAEHLSSSVLFSRVQNLQDQVVYFVFAILGFAIPQTSQIGARGCRRLHLNKILGEKLRIWMYQYQDMCTRKKIHRVSRMTCISEPWCNWQIIISSMKEANVQEEVYKYICIDKAPKPTWWECLPTNWVRLKSY
jgi:hypothetical protein